MSDVSSEQPIPSVNEQAVIEGLNTAVRGILNDISRLALRGAQAEELTLLYSYAASVAAMAEVTVVVTDRLIEYEQKKIIKPADATVTPIISDVAEDAENVAVTEGAIEAAEDADHTSTLDNTPEIISPRFGRLVEDYTVGKGTSQEAHIRLFEKAVEVNGKYFVEDWKYDSRVMQVIALFLMNKGHAFTASEVVSNTDFLSDLTSSSRMTGYATVTAQLRRLCEGTGLVQSGYTPSANYRWAHKWTGIGVTKETLEAQFGTQFAVNVDEKTKDMALQPSESIKPPSELAEIKFTNEGFEINGKLYVTVSDRAKITRELLETLAQFPGVKFRRIDIINHTNFFKDNTRSVRYERLRRAWQTLHSLNIRDGVIETGELGQDGYIAVYAKIIKDEEPVVEISPRSDEANADKINTSDESDTAAEQASSENRNNETTELADEQPWLSLLAVPLAPIERELVAYFAHKGQSCIELSELVLRATNLPANRLRNLIDGINQKAAAQGSKHQFKISPISAGGQNRTFVDIVESE